MRQRRSLWFCGLGVLVLVLALAWEASAQEQAPTPPRPPSRAVSLRVLQAALRAAGTRPAAALSEMCGLTRLEGYVVDRKTRDLILFGAADPKAPRLHTEDFAVALRSAWHEYGVRRGHHIFVTDPGCSIDPNPATVRRLMALGARMQSAGASRDMDTVLREWTAVAKEPQHVRVEGIPYRTHFAKTMVDADYYLKRLVDGSVSLYIPGFVSLTDALMEKSVQEILATNRPLEPISALNRFWFYPGHNRYGVDGDMLLLLNCPVTLLTEQEYIADQGVRGYGRPMPEAKEFATAFGAHYDEISAKRPIYQELEGLFRFVALAKVLKYRREPVDLHYLLETYPVPRTPVPITLPGRSRIEYYEHQTPSATGVGTVRMWLPSCGGVKIGTTVRASDFVSLRPTRTARLRPRGRVASASGDSRLRSQDRVRRPASRRAATRPASTTRPKPARVPTKHAILSARPSAHALYWDF